VYNYPSFHRLIRGKLTDDKPVDLRIALYLSRKIRNPNIFGMVLGGELIVEQRMTIQLLFILMTILLCMLAGWLKLCRMNKLPNHILRSIFRGGIE